MEYLKKKSGGCSSMNYSSISDNYMLMDNAVAKTGGALKKSSKRAKKGGSPLDDKEAKELFSGGNPLNTELFGGALRRRVVNGNKKDSREDSFGGALRRRGGEGEALAPQAQAPAATGLFGMGSAITDAAKQFGLTSGGAFRRDRDDKDKKEEGGCGLARCNKSKNDRKKGGTTGVELAPFISSLVILGLRAANDKALQSGITKKLGSLLSSSKKSKKSKKSSRAKSVSN